MSINQEEGDIIMTLEVVAGDGVEAEVQSTRINSIHFEDATNSNHLEVVIILTNKRNCDE